MWLPANARTRGKANQRRDRRLGSRSAHRRHFKPACLGRTVRELYRPKRMNTRKPIEVCITIDTEFSIGGNFENPALTPVAQPIVLGSVAGKEKGLGFLLDRFSGFGSSPTCFLEQAQTADFR